MNPTPARKLKRGLKDISPLFQDKSNEKALASVSEPKQGLEILSVYCPETKRGASFWNRLFAAPLATKDQTCSILSLHSTYKTSAGSNPQTGLREKSSLQQHSISWHDFEAIYREPQELMPMDSAQIVFLDFEMDAIPHVEKVIPLLDKWILVSQPNMESLSAIYKMMRAATALNHDLEYYVFFDGFLKPKQANFLFERLSEMVSKHLGISFVWLGALDLAHCKQGFEVPVLNEQLFQRKHVADRIPLQQALMSLLNQKPTLSTHA